MRSRTPARWVLPLQDAGRFQFARDAARGAATELERAAASFDRVLEIACDEEARAESKRRIRDERDAVAAFLRGRLPAIDFDACVERRAGDPSLYSLLDERLGDVAALDHAFAAAFVSRSSATPRPSPSCPRRAGRTISSRASRSPTRCGRCSAARPSPCTAPPQSGRPGTARLRRSCSPIPGTRPSNR